VGKGRAITEAERVNNKGHAVEKIYTELVENVEIKMLKLK